MKDHVLDGAPETETDSAFTPLERAFIESMVAAITKKLRSQLTHDEPAIEDREPPRASRRRA
jgi:hypothetical protein